MLKLDTMKEIKIKTIFFTSNKDENLEDFICEFIKICSKNNLSFKEICNIFDKLVLSSDD